MKPNKHRTGMISAACIAALAFYGLSANAADTALLDILLENGAITQQQYDELAAEESLTAEDIVPATEKAGETATVEMDETVEAAILFEAAHRRGLTLTRAVLDYWLHRAVRSLPLLMEQLNSLDEQALVEQQDDLVKKIGRASCRERV